MLRLAIAIGGAAGAFARHAAGTFVAAGAGSLFPWGTLFVNVSGSWILGLLMGLLPVTTVTPAVRAGLTIGFCGGFTTFSAFARESVSLAHQGRLALAAAYVAASLCLGVLAMFAGLELGTFVTRRRRRFHATIAREGASAPAPPPAPIRRSEDGR